MYNVNRLTCFKPEAGGGKICDELRFNATSSFYSAFYST